VSEERIALTESGGGSRKTGGDGPLSRTLEQHQGDLRGDDASKTEILQSFLQECKRVRNTPFAERLADPSGVRANMVMPLEQLPDLFLAVPVLYLYAAQDDGTMRRTLSPWGRRELRPQQRFLMELFDTQLWRDLYQIFNRKWRTMREYTGDTIPSSIQIRMNKACDVFDDIVICTPYHHVALMDLEEIGTWRPERHPEPYALGFVRDKQTYPFAVILGRFIENGGLFPNYGEMVDNTMRFLRRIVSDLPALNNTDPSLWHYGKAKLGEFPPLPGNRLADQMKFALKLHKGKILADTIRQGMQLT